MDYASTNKWWKYFKCNLINKSHNFQKQLNLKILSKHASHSKSNKIIQELAHFVKKPPTQTLHPNKKKIVRIWILKKHFKRDNRLACNKVLLKTKILIHITLLRTKRNPERYTIKVHQFRLHFTMPFWKWMGIFSSVKKFSTFLRLSK